MINSISVLHWFRRDLRISDNTALCAAVKKSPHIIPVYILSDWKIKHEWTGAPRQEFLCGCLRSLTENLARHGARLIIRQGQPDAQLAQLLDETGAQAIYFNRDPDPFGLAMEGRVRKMAETRGVAVHDFADITMHDREEILTATGQPYRVFTPYSKAWLKAPKPACAGGMADRGTKLSTPGAISSLPLPTLQTWRLKGGASIVEPCEKAARKRLSDFLAGPILQYGANRDIPSACATSRLSADLRFGTLSVRAIYHQCVQLAADPIEAEQRKSIQTFINELIWREFYVQVLWHWPEVLDHEFNPKYRRLKWRPADEAFDRWCQGETGFPIIDAAMRQLNATGFMHNRLRMISAMFLTKDLHIDWRHGEQYFMQRLVDGDIAANNGGWQWSAGTGADAAPYFRIQNPWSQTKRFDPNGAFIRQWLPELRDVAPAKLMSPPSDGKPLAKNYPAPMVDHAREREITLRMFSHTFRGGS